MEASFFLFFDFSNVFDFVLIFLTVSIFSFFVSIFFDFSVSFKFPRFFRLAFLIKFPLFCSLFTFGQVKGNARCGRSRHRSTNQSVRVCQVNLATPKVAMNTDYLLQKKKTGEKDVPRCLPIFESCYACHCSKLSLSIFFFLGDQMFERFACHGLFCFKKCVLTVSLSCMASSCVAQDCPPARGPLGFNLRLLPMLLARSHHVWMVSIWCFSCSD